MDRLPIHMHMQARTHSWLLPRHPFDALIFHRRHLNVKTSDYRQKARLGASSQSQPLAMTDMQVAPWLCQWPGSTLAPREVERRYRSPVRQLGSRRLLSRVVRCVQ